MNAGGPQILEPIMSTEVTVPAEYQGAAVAQLAQRKARLPRAVPAQTGAALPHLGTSAPPHLRTSAPRLP